jgi:deoxyribodipyrimidine photolyase-related protein
VLGWREYVHHVHEATAGLRHTLLTSVDHSTPPNHLQATEPLPAVYWGAAPSGLRCLDGAVGQVYRHGWTHHITRLMVLSNIATLLGVSPRALTDWFWVGYVDAYDWVVEPNVLGMGTFADGGTMMTKPYVSGAAYLHKMGDACARCAFDPTGKDLTRPCPLTPLYWDFLHRNGEVLRPVERLAMPLASARGRSEAQRLQAAAVRRRVLQHLRAGEPLPRNVAAVEP